MSLLKDILISPEEYNRLPYILDNADLESSNGQDIKDIISLFRKHKLPQAFKPKLVHKHYDIGDDEVMVSREIPVPTHGVVSIMGPMISQRAPTLRGLHYFVDGNGDLQAYEYTIGPAPDICRYDDFFKEFSDFIVERNLQNKLGLVIGDERNDKRIWREIEVPDKRGTIMIPDNVGLEKLGLKEGISTEFEIGSHGIILCGILCGGDVSPPETNDWFLEGKRMSVGTPLQLIVSTALSKL